MARIKMTPLSIRSKPDPTYQALEKQYGNPKKFPAGWEFARMTNGKLDTTSGLKGTVYDPALREPKFKAPSVQDRVRNSGLVKGKGKLNPFKI